MKQKMSTGAKLAIIALLLIIVVAVIFGLYAWARYVSQENGSSTAQVAKWYFDLKNTSGTSMASSGVIDLAETLNYNHVDDGVIAPGTEGTFQMVVDTRGTEVDLVYTIDVNLSNCPTNLQFYSDSNHTQLIPKTGNKLEIEQYLTHTQAYTYNETVSIYWQWKYETGTTTAEIAQNDELDRQDKGKTVSMQIQATAEQVQGDPNAQSGGSQSGGSQSGGNEPGENPPAANSVQALAQSGAIQRWDRIDYYPGNETTASLNLPEGASIMGAKMASINLPAGASLDGSISADSASDWVVLDVNETTGEVLIIPRTYSGTKLTLDGKDGYNNAVEALDAVASIYLNPAYATSARSIRVEDINKLEGHTPDGYVASATFNHRYGVDGNLNITDSGSDSITPSRTYSSTAITGWYAYSISFFVGENFWLASRDLHVVDYKNYSNCCFGVRVVGDLVMGHYGIWDTYSDGHTTDGNYGMPVLPVVSLKSTIQLNHNGTYEGEGFENVSTGAVTAAGVATGEHNVWEIQ